MPGGRNRSPNADTRRRRNVADRQAREARMDDEARKRSEPPLTRGPRASESILDEIVGDGDEWDYR